MSGGWWRWWWWRRGAGRLLWDGVASVWARRAPRNDCASRGVGRFVWCAPATSSRPSSRVVEAHVPQAARALRCSHHTSQRKGEKRGARGSRGPACLVGLGGGCEQRGALLVWSVLLIICSGGGCEVFWHCVGARQPRAEGRSHSATARLQWLDGGRRSLLGGAALLAARLRMVFARVVAGVPRPFPCGPTTRPPDTCESAAPSFQ